jgi:hypothetical protein
LDDDGPVKMDVPNLMQILFDAGYTIPKDVFGGELTMTNNFHLLEKNPYKHSSSDCDSESGKGHGPSRAEPRA